MSGSLCRQSDASFSRKMSSNNSIMSHHNKIPFNPLVDADVQSTEDETCGTNQASLKNIMGKFVGNLTWKKQRRYMNFPQYKHTRLQSTQEDTICENFDAVDEGGHDKRSTSMEDFGEISRTDFHVAPSTARMGRRRSRSDSDLLDMESFARRARRAAICEEMERDIFMANGITLRKCRKNLVLNQILENLSLL